MGRNALFYAWSGYARHNMIGRKVYTMEGDFISDEMITENNALMNYSPLLAENNSAPK
ncbi:hypothetical protein MNQ98_03140 [Paenibacillus sp. N3/727]|uniref:hypothetical protein n=1 Tax=Paenibacillus sp. N3/727 TaxID=2925845 RepID=UPI001F536164|nr:hypothetical protein [Paenibacillus sp. N3/727]UNK19051.1 hypothetical protein MNQ98_03140 [Paenibacillus sp. N3/727]